MYLESHVMRMPLAISVTSLKLYHCALLYRDMLLFFLVRVCKASLSCQPCSKHLLQMLLAKLLTQARCFR